MAPGSLFLVQDETDLLLFPPLRAAWTRVGQQATVRLSGYNAKRVIFGALDLRTGARYLRSRPRNRTDDFCAFLTWLRTQEPDRPILMLLDDGPSHTARTSRQTLVAVLDYLTGLSNDEALEKAGVLSPRFWLRHQRSKLF